MHEALRFWLERGVDGFRVDVIWHLMKDAEFRDNPPNPGYQPGRPEIERLLQVYSTDQPEVHDIIAGMRRVIDEFKDRVLIGEIYLPLERLVAYYGADLSGAHLPFNFQLIQTAWNAREIAMLVREYEEALPKGGWPNWVLGNHDQPRIAARVGAAQARVAAMLLLTLRGTPTMYYGDEIGLARGRDPARAGAGPLGEERARASVSVATPSGRRCSGTARRRQGSRRASPGCRFDAVHETCNVENLARDPGSILTLYRRLIALRRTSRALSIGSFHPVETEGQVFSYERREGAERLMVALNLGHEARTIALPADAPDGVLQLSTCLDHDEAPVQGAVVLRPDEGVLLKLGRKA